VTGYGLDGRSLIPGRGKYFPLLHSVQTGSGVHPASYPMYNIRSFPGGKVAGAWIWSLTSSAAVKGVELDFHSMTHLYVVVLDAYTQGHFYLLFYQHYVGHCSLSEVLFWQQLDTPFVQMLGKQPRIQNIRSSSPATVTNLYLKRKSYMILQCIILKLSPTFRRCPASSLGCDAV
jgi:hypothetical protein